MNYSDPITREALRYFQGSEGCELLVQAAATDQNPLRIQEQLRRSFPAEMCRAGLALVELRQRAGKKFMRAEEMFFDREGLEMATREEIAHYRAWRLRDCEKIMDLCCGIGGDLLALGQHAEVVAVDADRRRLAMAQHNSQVYELQQVRFIAAEAQSLRMNVDAVFVDPARRSGQRKRRGEGYSPPLSWVADLRTKVSRLAVKVGPAIPEEDLPPDCEVEFISSGGQCREGALYFGQLATTSRRATLLPERHTLETAAGPDVVVAPPGAYLFDPNPAVVRSHLLDELARRIGAWKLDPQIAYLSGDTATDSPFIRSYRLIRWQPFQLKRLRQTLRDEGLYPREIKKRGFPIEPPELRRRLSLPPDGRPITLLLTRLRQKPVVFICEMQGN
jgi:SAM-dependent methyltransferase